jgi:hypothetical protein
MRPRVVESAGGTHASGMRLMIPVLLLLSACATLPGGALPDDPPVIRQFAAVTLDSEFRGPSWTGRVAKWTGPVRYIVGQATPEQAAAVRRHMARIAALTGLDVAETTVLAGANFRVVFGPRSRFLPWLIAAQDDSAFTRRVAANSCFSGFESKIVGVIDHASAVIGTDIPDEIREHCTLEEIVQAFGPGNDACLYSPSLFCDGPGTYRMGLEPNDELILRVLYDPRLRPGMTPAEAMPIARQVFRELMAPR